MEITSCSMISWYVVAAIASYVAAHVLQVVLDLPLWEGQQQHHSPSDQHFELKQLVQKILEEIGKLPELLNQSGLPLRPEEHLPYFDPRKYEQLLATAVLNKVVDDYRNPKNFANVGAGDVAGKSGELGSTFDINHNKLPEGAAGHRGSLNEESLRQMSVVADESHPHEAILNGAATDRRLSDTDESYLSDYIQRHKVPLPDLSDTTGSGSGAEDDDLQSLKSNATDGTWEENWLFRKRQLKTTESSIAMLVPSPTEEVKALIGDKNADEISDLSEAGSDCEGYESDGNVKLHDSSDGRLPRAVGGPTSGSSKDTSEGISSSSRANDSLDEQLAPDSLVSINSLPGTEAVLSEAKNDQLLEDQVTPVVTGGNGVLEPLLVDDLISMEPIAEKVETKNPALTNPFLDDPFEANNNVITDDVKLLQRTDYRQSTSDNQRSFLEPSNNGSNNRKEIPIDRAQKEPANGSITTTQEETQGPEEPCDEHDEPDTLIPGSIAEREHLKWRNAKPIANNPYSPDALQRRLSEKTRPSSMIEIDRLVRKEAPSDAIICDDDPPGGPPVGDLPTKHEASAPQPVNGSALSEKKKIGREYYINDPERLRMGGGGTVKQTLGLVQPGPAHSTDDEKSLLLGRSLDEAAPSKTDSSFLQDTAPDAGQHQKSPKANYLSAVAREMFLLPLEPESEMRSLVSTSSEQSVTSPRQDFDSLTYSEDSDVTRIYDLTTGEAKVIRSGVVQALPRDPAPPEPEGGEEGDTILRILPQQQPAASQNEPNTQSQTITPPPQEPPQEERTFLRPVQVVVKPLSPETIKFFAPKRKLSFTGSNNNLTASATENAPNAMHSSLHLEFPASRTPCGSEFSIIEKDVIDVLPSVKELAKCYSGSTSDVSSLPPKPLYKPRVKLRKDFLRQSSDMLSEETVTIDEKTGMPCTKGQRQYCSTSSIAVRDEIREIRKINLEAYRQSTYYPMAPGHSITARSLSKQIREHKTNVTDDHKVGQQEEVVVESTGNDGDNGHTSPERPSSPVLLPGHLKSSIEFFESLRNNP
ncbi:uncharacterized protein LOC128269308 isoform X2 [Anopheles cruzii]|uniref:uncharacterized protein LOC128269308 isoform X2 n=1 Tax=Anopheles cruzii TaxID=68878 RepID=UPI0022EC6D11|nr:uncharacterized protein LOC128269308 isoform X2 [Anopheles cruzii]